MSSLAKALPEEITRVQELRDMYLQIPTGLFAAEMMRVVINQALDALKGDDVVAMLLAYENLKEFKE